MKSEDETGIPEAESVTSLSEWRNTHEWAGSCCPCKTEDKGHTHTHTHTKRVIALRHLIHDVQVRDNGQHHESVFRLAGIFALVQMETAVFFPWDQHCYLDSLLGCVTHSQLQLPLSLSPPRSGTAGWLGSATALQLDLSWWSKL